MATNVNSTKSQSQSTPSKSPQHQQQGQSSNFETLDKSTSNTLKRNPKMELSKNDLLKLLSYLEGELQARDVVIATLKSEKVKQLLHQGRYRSVSINDPLAALQRDSYAASEPRVDEAQIRALADHQMASLENLILQQRRAQIRMARILKDAEDRHKKVVQELEEEKRKHEHDTAQGDDITYGLEKERTRLKQELELEKQGKKKLEKEVKKIADTLEEERNRQKQIVLLLLAERKKIIMKYVEERKRSEDLAQILTEEKGRIDSMAEGLEEESKKSLQMEAELEKQLAQFDMERQQLKAAFCKEEKRCKEFESEVEKLRGEVDSVRKQLAEAHQVAMFQAGTNVSPPRVILPRTGSTATPPQPPAKPSIIPPQTSPRPGQPSGPGVPLTPPKVGPWGQPGSPRPDGSISPPPPPAGTPMMSSVAKVVQPTATVSSVPVCGPTTGIARSVSPGQGLRNIAYAPATAQDARTGTSGRGETSSWSATSQPSEQPSPQVPVEKSVARIAPSAERSQPQVVQVTPRVSLSASPGTKVFTTTQGGKVTFHVTANAAAASTSIPPPSQPPVLPGPSSTTQTASTTVPQAPKKPLPLGRGVPPPVPPNKPVVPPKKEVVSRTVVQTGRPDIAVDPNQPISFEVKPQKVGPQGVKFGITISKDKIHITNPQATSSNDIVVSQGGLANASLPNPGTTSALDSNQPIRRDPQVGAPSGEVSQLPQSPVDIQSTSVGAKCETLSLPGSVPTPSSCPASSSKSKATNDDARNGSVVARREVARPALHESPGLDMLGQELADFQEMLVSMATGSSDIAASSTNPFPAQAASSVDDSISPCVSTTSAAITDDEKKEKLMNCCVSVKCPVQDDSAKTSQHCINLNEQDSLGRNPLYYALLHGNEAAAAFLIKQGATLGIITKDNSTILHAAVMSGNVQCVQVVLEALAKQLNHSSQNSPCSAKEFSNLFTRKDDHGKTPLHLAAVLDHDDCLQLLLSYFSDCFLDVRDNDGRTVYDVASKTCKALLYSLHGDHENGGGHYCSVLMCPERHGSQYQIGCLTVDREMTWQALTKKLIGLASNHWEIISKGLELTKKEKRRGHCSASDNKLNQELGLSAKSILRFEIGDHHWIEKAVDDNELLPCEVISNTAKKEIRIILSCKSQLDGLAYEILVPISLLQNYTRLIEQYKNLVFYGPRLVGKTRLATRLVEHLLWKHRSEKRRMIVCFLEFKKCNLDETERVPNGLKSNMDVGHESAPIEVVLNHKTRLKLNEVTGALVECGLLLTAPTTEEANIPVVVLDNICKDVCTSDIGILITGLDKCGATNPLKLGEQQNVYYVNPSSYIIGTMDTAGAIGIDLNLYQNLRWVHLRWDVEPVCGMLNHTLARELLHANGGILPPPYDSSYKLLQWITSVWVRMNESFVGLGLPDSILGPHLLSGCFQSDEHCAPISRQHSVLRFIQNVWNSHVVSEVRRKIFATPHSSAEQQEKVLSVALGVMLLRVVVPNAPLSVTERHSFLRSLTGGSELDSAAVRRKLRGSWAGSTAEERREYLHVGARSKCERKRSRSSCSSPVGEQEKYHPSFTALTETSHIKDISTSSSSNSSDSSESSSHCLQTDLNKTIHQDMPSDSSRDNDEQEGCGSLSVTEEAASDNSELPDEPAFNTLTMELAKLEAALKKSVIGDNGLRVLNVALSSD